MDAFDVFDTVPRVAAEVFPCASNVPVVVEGELMATAVPVGRLFHCQLCAAALAGAGNRKKGLSNSARSGALRTGDLFIGGALEAGAAWLMGSRERCCS